MEPSLRKGERKLFFTHDLPQRVNCAALCPLPAPNGSTVILYGHDNGLRALWRGGRKIKEHRSKTNGLGESDPDIIILDASPQSQTGEHDKHDEYMYEELELDSEHAFASILYTADYKLSSAVTKISIPYAQHNRAELSDVTVVLSTSDGSVQILRIPLTPPSSADADREASAVLNTALHLKDSTAHVRALASKHIHEFGEKIVVAAISDKLQLWQIPLEDELTMEGVQYVSRPSTSLPTTISFHPAPRSHQFLIADSFGDVAVSSFLFTSDPEQGHAIRWLFTISTPFKSLSDTTATRSAPKRLLDAQFVLDGRCIFALLQDGQWGIWDITGSSPGKHLDQFLVNGYLESSTTPQSLESLGQKRFSALTPMTPNTRKAKSNDLFTAQKSKGPRGPGIGGLSVSRTTSNTGVVDESVMIWHDGDVYTIPSMQSFWQRSTSSSTGLNTLYAPGINRVQGVNLFNERITSISQLAPNTPTSGIGQLKLQRDIVISAEHRLLVVQSETPQRDTRSLVLTGLDTKDQRMLDVGELDLRGMDRMLSNMDSRRKVGFAN